MSLGLPPKQSEKNPMVPKDNQSLLIGVTGISELWEFWQDTPRGKDSALAWLQNGPNPKRLFRIYLDGVTELEIIPAVAAQLREKPDA